MERKCPKCEQVKPLVEFIKDNRRQDGRGSYCKACHTRLYYQKRPKPKRLEPGDVKQCTKCGKAKPVEEFDKAPRYCTGYVSQCKECRRAGSRDWKRRHKKQVREYHKQWCAEHPDYYPEYERQYRTTHRKQKRAQDRQWYADHRTHILAYQKRYYAEHTQQIKEQVKRYQHTPKGKAVVVNVRHKRRIAKQDSDITAEWLAQLYGTQTVCAYCGAAFSDELPATLDHIMPLSKGGTHTKNNVVLCCRPCNNAKGNKWVPTGTSDTSELPCQLLLGFLLES